jgi:hypothetical protein
LGFRPRIPGAETLAGDAEGRPQFLVPQLGEVVQVLLGELVRARFQCHGQRGQGRFVRKQLATTEIPCGFRGERADVFVPHDPQPNGEMNTPHERQPLQASAKCRRRE